MTATALHPVTNDSASDIELSQPYAVTIAVDLDQRRVMVQRNGITRSRPALLKGWRAEFELLVQVPEYVPPSDLQDVLTNAGRLIGLGDFRPTYGRFMVTRFEVQK
jgi:hypothetical protein